MKITPRLFSFYRYLSLYGLVSTSENTTSHPQALEASVLRLRDHLHHHIFLDRVHDKYARIAPHDIETATQDGKSTDSPCIDF